MTKLEALRELKAKVEDGGLNVNNKHWLSALDAQWWDFAWKAYRGSLDAAKALHEAVLPGWSWEFGSGGIAAVWIKPDEAYKGRNKDIARAWLTAILSALIAQEEQK